MFVSFFLLQPIKESGALQLRQVVEPFYRHFDQSSEQNVLVNDLLIVVEIREIRDFSAV